MEFVLKYNDSQEVGFPAHKSKVCYYVLKDNFHLKQNLHPQYSDITYEWYSECWEVNEYYDPTTESHYALGDSKPSTHFTNSDKPSHHTVYLCLILGGDVFMVKEGTQDMPHIAWMYTHTTFKDR